MTTDDEAIAAKIRMIRDHGHARKYYHYVEGYNGRLDAIQAGFLALKLRYLSKWNAKRREAAAFYNNLFAKSGADIVTPYEPSWSKAVYHLYVIRCAERDGLRNALEKKGIGTGIHYPIPLHLQNAYTNLGYKAGDFPASEAASAETLSVPMFPTLTTEQQRVITGQILQFIAKNTSMAIGTSRLSY